MKPLVSQCLGNIMHNAIVETQAPEFNIRLGRELFSDPQRDKSNCVVVANHEDITAGINAGDLVRIDFTENKIGSDGLYVITLDDGWAGYRFFDRRPNLVIVDPEKLIPVTHEVMCSIKVIGKVKDIYQSRLNPL